MFCDAGRLLNINRDEPCCDGRVGPFVVDDDVVVVVVGGRDNGEDDGHFLLLLLSTLAITLLLQKNDHGFISISNFGGFNLRRQLATNTSKSSFLSMNFAHLF